MGYVTKMDLPPLVRGQVARLLQQRLARFLTHG